MNSHPKYLQPPKFLCIPARALLITVTCILLVLSFISIGFAIYDNEITVFPFIPLIPQLIVLLAALLVALWTLHIARVTLVIWMIIVVAYGLFYTVYDTAAMATNKVDDGLEYLWEMNNATAMQNSTMFERGTEPEELFKSAIEFGYTMEITFVIVFGLLYLQYSLVKRLLKFVRVTRVGDSSVI